MVPYLHSLCSHQCWRLGGSLNREKIGESHHFAITLLLSVIKPPVLQTQEGAHVFCSKLRVSLNWMISSECETHATKHLQRPESYSTVTWSLFRFFDLGEIRKLRKPWKRRTPLPRDFTFLSQGTVVHKRTCGKGLFSVEPYNIFAWKIQYPQNTGWKMLMTICPSTVSLC